jgi:DNA polymerase elongation subunit (family B)
MSIDRKIIDICDTCNKCTTCEYGLEELKKGNWDIQGKIYCEDCIPRTCNFCKKIVKHENKAKDQPENAVLNVKLVTKENIYGFHGNKTSQFLCIDVLLPKYIPTTKRVLESGFECPGFGLQGYQTFESNIDFEIRFMADLNITGCNWIEIPAKKYRIREKNEMTSRSQLEIDVLCKDIISHTVEGEWLKIAPLRILSFDIECAGRKGTFPEPDKDPVIQIASGRVVDVIFTEGADIGTSRVKEKLKIKVKLFVLDFISTVFKHVN